MVFSGIIIIIIIIITVVVVVVVVVVIIYITVKLHFVISDICILICL